MDDRLVKVIGGLLILGLVLCLGAMAGGVLVYGLIRVDPLSAAQAQAADPGYGLVIARVEPDSPAEDAGVVRGDILLEIDGVALDQSDELSSRLGDFDAGDEVELTLLHGDEKRTLAVVLGERLGGPYLGVYPCPLRTADAWLERGTAGAIVTEVLPGSPAEEAGLVAGDVILAVGSERLDAGAELADVIAAYEPGDSVVLEIEGEDGPRTVDIVLGEHPEDESRGYLGVRYGSRPEVGYFEWRSPPPTGEEDLDSVPMPLPFPHMESAEGLMVLRVAENSPASEAGLMAGDLITAVDGEQVATAEQLTEIVADSEPGDMISLTVSRFGTAEGREVDVIVAEDPDEDGKPYLGVTLWPVPHWGNLEGEGPHFWEPESFGLDELPFSLPEGIQVQGAIVLSVEDGSPAGIAGLGEGDVITAVDGDPLDGPKGLVDLISSLEPGDKVSLTVVGADSEAESEIEVTLGEHPDEKGKAYLGVEIGAYRRMERRGALERPYSYDSDGERFRFNLPLDELPFDLQEMPDWFDFPWTPGEEDCVGPGCSDDSA